MPEYQTFRLDDEGGGLVKLIVLMPMDYCHSGNADQFDQELLAAFEQLQEGTIIIANFENAKCDQHENLNPLAMLARKREVSEVIVCGLSASTNKAAEISKITKVLCLKDTPAAARMEAVAVAGRERKEQANTVE